MQNREPLGSIRPDDLATNDLAGAAPSAEIWDLSNANHDAAALLLQKPARDRIRTAGVAAAALAVTFALGWVGGLTWQEFAGSSASNQVAQKETPAPRIAGALGLTLARRHRERADRYARTPQRPERCDLRSASACAVRRDSLSRRGGPGSVARYYRTAEG